MGGLQPHFFDLVIKNLDVKLRDCAQKGLSSLHFIREEPEIDEAHQEKAREFVTNRGSFYDAVNYLCCSIPYSDLEQISQLKESLDNEFFLSGFFSTSLIGKTGLRTKLSKDGINSKEAIFTRGTYYFLNNWIIPALMKIREEYIVSKEDIERICKESGIINDEEIGIVTEGLYFGFKLEFSISAHVLAPHLENIVRELIISKSGNTVALNKDSTLREVGLSALVNTEELKEMLEDSVLFEMKAIFTEKEGFNLRNEIAHGFVFKNQHHDGICAYAWFYILRFIVCCRFS